MGGIHQLWPVEGVNFSHLRQSHFFPPKMPSSLCFTQYCTLSNFMGVCPLTTYHRCFKSAQCPLLNVALTSLLALILFGQQKGKEVRWIDICELTQFGSWSNSPGLCPLTTYYTNRMCKKCCVKFALISSTKCKYKDHRKAMKDEQQQLMNVEVLVDGVDIIE